MNSLPQIFGKLSLCYLTITLQQYSKTSIVIVPFFNVLHGYRNDRLESIIINAFIMFKTDNIIPDHTTLCYHKTNYKISANLQQNPVDICGSEYRYTKKHTTNVGKHFVENILPRNN